MNLTYVLMQNLRRNRLRTILTSVAFALPMAVFVFAISFVVVLIQVSKANERELRLAVRNKISLINPMPEGLRGKIEALDPNREKITSVCGMRWFGGRVPDTQNTLTSLAADADSFPVTYPDVGMTADIIEEWKRDRRAAVAGLGPAERHGWKAGDRVVLESTVPPYLNLEFRIVHIITNPERANFFFFRRDYLVESLKEAGVDDARCNSFWVKCNSLEARKEIQDKIDQAFANTPDETKTEDENAFGANFTQAAGNIPGLMQTMSLVVVLIVSMVAGNSMMMSFRERTRELAVFKAIGFHSGRVFRIVLAESLLLATIGSLAGVLPAALALYFFPLRRLNFGPISAITISPAAVIGSLLIALVVGLIAGIIPAWQALRLRSIDALRRA